MKNTSRPKAIIAYLTTFPPRECGIATFTRDLSESFDQMYSSREETKIIAMRSEGSDSYTYPGKVINEVRENVPEDYIAAANMLNAMEDVVLVAIEHEYGIYGNGYGKNLLCFLDKIKKPVSVTCHTALPNPVPEMKEIMKKIISRADIVIVMTEASAKILKEVYGAEEGKVKVIPHGIHPASYTDGEFAKRKLGFSGKKIISTFGFLSRGKGIEYGIRAMPGIVKRFPDCLYLVIGETHPVVKKSSGEEYRQSLQKMAKELGVEKNVVFFDKFLKTTDLLVFLEATDIYLSLSQNTDQAVSGTLSYALGAGRPVIATPFSQAKEVITPKVGALVRIGESDDIEREVIALLSDDTKRIALGKNAYFHTRIMTWPNVALSYMREFASLAPVLAKRHRVLPALKLSHLVKLTDDFGVFQFAVLDKPDPAWGYTLDDNARALVAMAWCANQDRDRKTSKKLARVYLSFIERALQAKGKFHNYFTADGKPHDARNIAENLEDASARAFWALAEASQSKLPWLLRNKAKKIFKKHLSALLDISSPRATAFIIKAMAVWLKGGNDPFIREHLVERANFLAKRFSESLGPSWQWFEGSLTYSNGIIPEAMLLAFKVTGNPEYFKIGKSALDFLIQHSFDGDVAVPVGHIGWFHQGGKKHIYDQQPEEISALVLAIYMMLSIQNGDEYEKKMYGAFNWFLGNNILNQMVYSEMTGGCYDGISEKEVNLNQGAESTVCYLLARIALDGKLDSKRV